MVLDVIVDRVLALKILRSGEKVIVAVSGGPDSIALLRVLDAIRPLLGLKLHVAHLDHGFRGQASAQDAIFVRQLSNEMSLPSTIGFIDMPKILRKQSGSSQALSRTYRYRFLRQVMNDLGADSIALGHNKNDQAETFLQNLIRGSGMLGLGGMGFTGVGPDHIPLIRPMLSTTRQEILDLLLALDQPYCTDSTNDTDVYQRNHIRHHLIPFLETNYNRHIVERIFSSATLLREEDRFLEDLVRQWAEKCLRHENNRIILSCRTYEQVPPVLQRRLCRHAYLLLVGSLEGLSTRHVEHMQQLAAGALGRRVDLPHKVICERVYDEVHLSYGSSKMKPYCIKLCVPGETVLPDGGVLVTRVLAKEEVGCLSKTQGRAFLHQKALKQTLWVRNRRPGDRFKPLGAPGSKKLKDFFIDEKIPYHMRDKIPLVVSLDGCLLWVVPHRISEAYKVTDSSDKVLVCYYREGQ